MKVLLYYNYTVILETRIKKRMFDQQIENACNQSSENFIKMVIEEKNYFYWTDLPWCTPIYEQYR